MAGLLKSDRLSRFLAQAASQPFDRKTRNCGLWLADWAMCALDIPDPAAHLRGSEWRTICWPMRSVVKNLGLARTDSPVRGDVAIVNAGPAVGAIRGADCWWVLDRQVGLMMLRKPRFIAWGLGYA